VFYISGPSNSEYLSHAFLLPVTAPVALLGRQYAITWYWSTVINAAIYSCIGLAVETLRLAVQSRRPS
jgi:hypothetical protein